jgi:hypothetical protein
LVVRLCCLFLLVVVGGCLSLLVGYWLSLVVVTFIVGCH